MFIWLAVLRRMSGSGNPPTYIDPNPRGDSEELARERAIRQIERRRHFRVQVVVSANGMAILVAIWATSEYHNAGGWPTQGFSQSSGMPNVWNLWIIYPVIGWVLILAWRAWFIYGHKPIPENEIRREIERQAGGH